MWTLTRLTILRPVSPPAGMIAIFGPTGVGKTEVALALAERLRAEGEDPVAISADALQVYEGLGTLTGAAGARGAGAPRAPARRLPARHRVLQRRRLRAARARGDRRARSPRAGGRSWSGGTGLYLRAALADLDLRPPADAGGARALARRADRRAGPPRCTTLLAERAPAAAAGVAPSDGRRIVRALELLDTGVEPPPAAGGDSQLWTTRHAPPDAAGRPRDGPRRRSRERIDRRVEAMVAAGARDEVLRAAALGASPTARQALGLRGAARGRRRGDEDPHPPLRQAPADVDAQAARRAHDRRHRPRGGGRRGASCTA